MMYSIIEFTYLKFIDMIIFVENRPLMDENVLLPEKKKRDKIS